MINNCQIGKALVSTSHLLDFVHMVKKLTCRVFTSPLYPLPMVTHCILLISAPFCTAYLLSACNFLVGSHNRVNIISYTGRFSSSSSWKFLIMNPSAMPWSINLTTVSLSSLFNNTMKNWDLGSNWIGAVMILVPLYQTWKVDINDNYFYGLYSACFTLMMTSLSFSVLTMLAASTIVTSIWPMSYENP